MGAWALRAFAKVVPLIPQIADFAIRIEGIEAIVPNSPSGVSSYIKPPITGETEVAVWNWIRQHGGTTLGDDDPIC